MIKGLMRYNVECLYAVMETSKRSMILIQNYWVYQYSTKGVSSPDKKTRAPSGCGFVGAKQ